MPTTELDELIRGFSRTTTASGGPNFSTPASDSGDRG